MGQEFDAIFENGVLRPLAPLGLGDSVEVRVILQAKDGQGEMAAPTPTELQTQQAALDDMFRTVDSLRQTPRNDGFSNRDHDKILYGSSQ